jgi:hypothetical protein
VSRVEYTPRGLRLLFSAEEIKATRYSPAEWADEWKGDWLWKGDWHVERMLQFFRYEHLPEKLQAVSKPWCDLAHHVVDTLPQSPERTVALRKLLEGKDAAVRAALEGAA